MPNERNDEKLPLSEIGPAEAYNAKRKDRVGAPLRK
jgi:hypothetical protein